MEIYPTFLNLHHKEMASSREYWQCVGEIEKTRGNKEICNVVFETRLLVSLLLIELIKEKENNNPTRAESTIRLKWACRQPRPFLCLLFRRRPFRLSKRGTNSQTRIALFHPTQFQHVSLSLSLFSNIKAQIIFSLKILFRIAGLRSLYRSFWICAYGIESGLDRSEEEAEPEAEAEVQK